MSVFLRRNRLKLLFAFVLAFCLGAITGVMAMQMKENLHMGIKGEPFSVLILGDSQMAGAGWEGGYANCIQEAYPEAKVINLARSGSYMSNGDIRSQWDMYLAEGYPEVDFVLLDGGFNDLPYIYRDDYLEEGSAFVIQTLRSLIEQIHEASPDTRIIYTMMPPFAEWKDSDNGPPAYEVQKSYWKKINLGISTYDYVTVLDLFSFNPFHYPCVECYHKYFADSIHLNEAGYRKSFEHINNVFTARLAQ